MNKTRVYYEKYGILFHKSYKWECEEFRFCPEGMGDCMTNTGTEAINRNEPKYLIEMQQLLINHKRWPDCCNNWGRKYIAKTKIRYGWSKLCFRYLKITKHRLFRTQHGLTRDPYTFFFAACKLLGKEDLIEGVHPPLSIYSPTFWAWQRYIHTGNKKFKIRYERRQLMNLPHIQFVKDMAIVRAKAAGSTELLEKLKSIEVKPNKG